MKDRIRLSRKTAGRGTEDRSSTETSLNYYSTKMDEDFIKAAKSGDLDKIKECHDGGVSLTITNPGGLNALHLAARENHIDILKYLLKHGIGVKAITKRLNTALHIASLGGNTDIVKILLENDAPVNVQAQDAITPLYMAAQENHFDVVKLLLKHKADPHIAAKGGFEPVDIAVLQRHTKVATMLLEHNSKGLRAIHMATKKDDTAALGLLLSEKKNVNERASNGYTPLHIASKHGSVNAANFLVDNGADLNAPAKHNVVPLHVASRHGQLRTLAVLIEGGADLAAATKDGLTALHCASRDGHEHCVELLLVHGAPITAKTRHGLTALHMSSQGNHTASANHILSHGAHIDDITLDGVTPLHITAHYGHVETAQLLIDKGADINCRAKNGYTALHIAAKKNREAIVQLLLKYKVQCDVKNNNGQTALHVAVFFGHVNIVLLLLQAGASLEATTIREETVLHIACRTTQIQIVRLLLRNGAKVNPKSRDEDTPLHNACRQGSASLISLLLDSGADPNAVNKDGCTPLHLVARDGQEQSVDCMLDHSADVRVVSKRGFTPLHEAAKKGHLPIINLLLERKADVNAKGKYNLTPLHVACHYDQPDVAVKLLDSGADPHATAKNDFTPLHISARKNQINIVRLLLERGVEANMVTKNGVSPLHLAAREGNVEVVELLLEHGASPGVETTNGLTPLHIAVQYNRINVIKCLLKYGAQINASTQNGFTPLHLAASYGNTEAAETLLLDGAEVEAKTKNGNTPLHIASYKGHNDIVQLLLKFNAPPNALNKDGYTALYIAEVSQQTIVITTLVKVTKVSLKKKNKEPKGETRWELVRKTFLAPESLEETLLIDAGDEAEDEAHIQKKIIQEDFEESFAGLDDTKAGHQVTESEIEVSTEEQVENMATDYEDFLNNLDGPVENGLGSGINGHTVDVSSDFVGSSSPRELRNISHPDNVYITEPPRHGKFLISFYTDARGATMESKQTGIKVIIPRGACSMPVRVMCQLKRERDRRNLPNLGENESLVNNIVHMSPAGVQFLKPVILEIPHYAALHGSDRELTVMRRNVGSSQWKEHVSTVVDDEKDEDVDSGNSVIKVIIQEVPEKLAIISRPRKERFVMLPEGGSIKSSVSPQVKIIFPPNTLNTSTKVVLQVQNCDDDLLQADDQTFISPIVSLDPPTNLSKPITVNIPCPWLRYEERNGKKNLRLLAWLPKSPRKSTGDRVEHEWQDITSKTALSIVGDNASFTTTDFTKYWLIQTNSAETLTKRVMGLQQSVSSAPFACRFVVLGRLNTPREAEFRILAGCNDEALKNMVDVFHTFTEVARSSLCNVYNKQTIHVNLMGNMTSKDSQSLRMLFDPFKVNRLRLVTDVMSDQEPTSCRLTFIKSLRRSFEDTLSTLCTLDAHLTTEMTFTGRRSFPIDTIDDEAIRRIGCQTLQSWMPVADELGMTKRDKQAVIDISCGRDDLPSVKLLEFWRAKNPEEATYKALFDALKYAGLDHLAEEVYNNCPNEFSRELLPRRDVRSRSITPTGRKTPDSLLDAAQLDPNQNGLNRTSLQNSANIGNGKNIQNGFHENSWQNDDTLRNSYHDSKPLSNYDGNDSEKWATERTSSDNLNAMSRMNEEEMLIDSIQDELERNDMKYDGIDDTDICRTTEVDETVVGVDPVVDLSILDELMDEFYTEQQETSPDEPSAYELSLIRVQQEEDAATLTEDVGKKATLAERDVVDEDILSNVPIQDVCAELDLSVLDRPDQELHTKDEPSEDPEGKHPPAVDQFVCDNDSLTPPESPNHLDDDKLPDDLFEGSYSTPNSLDEFVVSPDINLSASPEVVDDADSISPCHVPTNVLMNFDESNTVNHNIGTTMQVVESVNSPSTFIATDVTEDDSTIRIEKSVTMNQTTVVTKTTHVLVTEKVAVDGDAILTSQNPDGSNVEIADESGQDMIKRMFGQQSSVLDFFDTPDKKNAANKEEDLTAYGTQV